MGKKMSVTDRESGQQGALTQAQVEQFKAEGYLKVPDVFTRAELEPLRREIAGIVDKTAQRLKAEGHITNLHTSEPFETRLTRLLTDHPEWRSEYLHAIEGKAGGGHTGREMFNIITHPRLIDCLKSLLGSEIVGSSVYRIRPKVPGLDRGIVPWHQDSGYFEPHCDEYLIVTCWIPLVDATPANGCLQVLPRVHQGRILTHRTGGHAGYLVIQDEDLPLPPDKAVTVPVPLGDVLLMTNLTPHCSTPNTTDVIRWSVDLRYQSASAPTNALQEPEDFDPNAPEIQIACYAPEADFVVLSESHPGNVTSYEEFAGRRARYDNAVLPYPQRGWQPAGKS